MERFIKAFFMIPPKEEAQPAGNGSEAKPKGEEASEVQPTWACPCELLVTGAHLCFCPAA